MYVCMYRNGFISVGMRANVSTRYSPMSPAWCEVPQATMMIYLPLYLSIYVCIDRQK